jgi:hypothetical protein
MEWVGLAMEWVGLAMAWVGLAMKAPTPLELHWTFATNSTTYWPRLAGLGVARYEQTFLREKILEK